MAFMKNSMARLLAHMGNRVVKSRLQDKQFTVFSNDCWGAEIYRNLRLPYQTPFVGLFMLAPCYIGFLKRPKHYLAQEFVFVDESKYSKINEKRAAKGENYPIGVLDGVEVHFLHYDTPKQAAETWERRAARIRWDRLLVKFDSGKDMATPAHLAEFNTLD
jgi:uncharacterized protein (DUF1919 family)